MVRRATWRRPYRWAVRQRSGQFRSSHSPAESAGRSLTALFFAERGHKVTGIDFLEQPIAEASQKAQQRGLGATFLVMDALALGEIPEQFDSVIDCGLFHVLSDADRARYVTALASAVKPGGRLFLCCFSDQEPPGQGPRRVSRQELHDAFAQGW
ncbi:MAG: class I SAM-dependent methyltransferase, partial [Planctomycetota bacterium]|nr:class I SAM-dependent methyltransferase [Planctomycetota bacterium]